MRLSDTEAYETFKSIRWAANEGDPFCPRCGCAVAYEYRSRRIYKCKDCGSQFSLTTGTIFASRKLSIRDLLAAIAIFANGAKGISALQLSRDLDVQYKTGKRRAVVVMRERGGKTLPVVFHTEEAAWREDNRRVPNGDQYLIAVNAALSSAVSEQWKGYWQRNIT